MPGPGSDSGRDRSTAIGPATWVRLGPAAAVVLVLVSQAVLFDRRITTLTDTAQSSDGRLQKIETATESLSSAIVELRIALERSNGERSADIRVLRETVTRLEKRIEALESR